MRLLITNADGIDSPGLCALARAAARFGDVRIVAPDVEMASTAHSITSSRPLRYQRMPIQGFEAFCVNGTPADGVALGLHHWEALDVVLSGINPGSNLGRDHFWFVVKPLEPADHGSDRWAVERGYTSMTPLRLDLTNQGLCP